MTVVVLTTAPAAPFLPASVHGQSVVIIGVCYAGSIDEGEHAIAGLRRLGPLMADTIGPTPYFGHQGAA